MTQEIQHTPEATPRALNTPNYIFIGIDPDKHAQEAENIEQNMPRWKQEQRDKYTKAELTADEAEKLRKAEHIAKNYLKRKVASYSLKADYIDDIEIDYITDTGIEGAGGFHDGVHGTTYAVVESPLSETVTLLSHELSHAATRHIFVDVRSEDGGNYAKSFAPIGFEQMNADKSYSDGVGLENMFAIWDQIDIMREVSKTDLFPREERARYIARLSPKIYDEAFKEINNSWFGPITQDELYPLVSLRGETLLRHGVGVVLAPSYFLIREICRVVGFDMYKSDLSMTGMTTEQVIQAGRAKLDKCRYTGSLDGRETLQKLFGEEGLKLLLSLSDRSLNGFDDAMKMVREKELTQGSLPITPMKWEPLNWDQFV